MEREDVVPVPLTPEQWEEHVRLFARVAHFLREDGARFGGTFEGRARLAAAQALLNLQDDWERAKVASEAWLSELTGENRWPEDVRSPQATNWEDGR